MASAFSHAVVALALGRAVPNGLFDGRVLWIGALCAILPDADVLGFSIGIAYGDLWGHRGMTHSLVFALLLGVAVAAVGYRDRPAQLRLWLAGYFAACTASHGLLDAMTSGGLGVAFFAPFDPTRYFFPLRPVLVSPVGVGEFFSRYGLHVIGSEILWIWGPALAWFLLCRGLWTIRLRKVPAGPFQPTQPD
ncbi:metal-dependent hydrolase [Nitrospirales bacterium NOB]|nr:MAG: Inner membrane protein YbcI [Nitrospira sp. OLB3]MBV6471576.1 Inner membrane protein YbcI [Nitrospirota bacterium]MCE7964414.1 metal-dependent hydrolase [Nitrospira sp. NTP2]MDL1889831.1 metal-dependent hydrolase [Nitrospirales bacterium NOB]QOJ34175.1 MAG: metal-dependent hydrolase [Nitrospira sp.]